MHGNLDGFGRAEFVLLKTAVLVTWRLSLLQSARKAEEKKDT